MRRYRILTWHVHGNYLYYLSHAPHDFHVLSKPGRGPGYSGRIGSLPWGDNVIDCPVATLPGREFDCVLYQSREHYLNDRESGLSVTQRRLPAIYLEHDPPLQHPTNTRHPVADPNVLVVHVQPDEGVSLAIGAKVPGAGMSIRTVHMDFLYGGAFREGVPEAYERLILDAMLGDATLFTREDEVDEQWKLVDAMVGAWGRDRPSFPNYAAGSWGPALADELLQRDGRSWRRH